jgi:hypothetical protein
VSPVEAGAEGRAAARDALHRVCAHVLARRRYRVSGRFGLRAGPAGIATPAFGEAPEVLRIAGAVLVREIAGDCTWTPLDGASLRQLATFAGTDLDSPFDCGADTPPVGDADAELALPPTAVDELSAWFALAWRVLDELVPSLEGGARATTVQLWPEHFDAATTVTLPGAEPVNLGFSPGDGYEDEPYVYVGPRSSARPGDPAFWNAPFGALRRRSELTADDGGVETAVLRFLRSGVGAATATRSSSALDGPDEQHRIRAHGVGRPHGDV